MATQPPGGCAANFDPRHVWGRRARPGRRLSALRRASDGSTIYHSHE